MSRPIGIFRQMNFLQAAKISEGTVTILPVIVFTEPIAAQDFRQERDLAGCHFAAENSKNSQRRCRCPSPSHDLSRRAQSRLAPTPVLSRTRGREGPRSAGEGAGPTGRGAW